jgi:hypothetical protein
MLAVKGDLLSPELAENIAALKGMEALVCEYSAEVSFNTFGGFERVAVAGLERRLEAFDPRMDPYMSGLKRYFRGARQGDPWRILYLKSSRRPFVLRRQLAALLGPEGSDWRLPPAAGTRKLLVLAAFAVATLLVLAGTSGAGRVLALLSVLPWLPRVAAGSPLDLYSFLLLFPLWVPLAESCYALLRDRSVLGWRGREGGRVRPQALLLAGGFLLAALLFRPSGGGEAAGWSGAAWYLKQANMLTKNSVSLAAGLLLLILAAMRFRYRNVIRFHAVFQPLPIRTENRPQAQQRLPAAGLLLLAAVAFPLLLLAAERAGLTAPRPAATGGPGGVETFSWRSIAALSQPAGAFGQGAFGQGAFGQGAGGQGAGGQGAEYLPDLADYLAHQAFQEGLPFGRPYRFPSPGERITLSHYLVAGDSLEVVKTYRVVKRYQSAWLGQTLRRAEAGNVEGLLVAQGAPLKVVSLAEHAVLRQAFPPAKQLILMFYLLAALLLPEFYLTASLLYGNRKLLIRRKQHVL